MIGNQRLWRDGFVMHEVEILIFARFYMTPNEYVQQKDFFAPILLQHTSI